MSDLESNLYSILQEKCEKIIPENIKKDVQIFDITGTYEGLDTSDADAIPLDIVAPRTAYVNGQKITGTLQGVDEFAPIGIAGDADNITLETFDETINVVTAEYTKTSEPTLLNGNCKITAFMKQSSVATAAGLTPEKIVSGNTILGVEGTATQGVDTSDANATAEDINLNKTAYVNGQKIIGSLPLFPNTRTFTVDNAGVTDNTEDSQLTFSTINMLKQTLDSNLSMEFSANYTDIATAIGLTADKLKKDEVALGITGTYEGSRDSVDNYINLQPTETTITFSNLIKAIPQINTQNVTSMKSMFQNLINVATIPQLDTSNVKNMNSMFYGCTSLESIPNLTTSSVTNMGSMFYGCTNIATIPQLDTSNVTDMSNMFYKCTNLESIPNLTTSKVTTTYRMFAMCSNITTVPQLNTSNVTNISQMFDRCSSLKNIPLLDTNKVTNMLGMVNACTSFTNTDLNTVLQMCANAVNVTSNKTLEYIGLSHDQASICKTLSNYSAFTEAGWTTGYSDLD